MEEEEEREVEMEADQEEIRGKRAEGEEEDLTQREVWGTV